MKQKLNKITSVILFCLVLIFSGCVRDELPDNTMINQEPKIDEAKSWFEDYKAKESFYPIFIDVNYHWDQATVTVLEDGSKAITVPLTDLNQDPEYKGEKILYLYPFEKTYDAVVYELTPDPKQSKKSDGFQKLDSYDGYISTWDLKKGFVKGQKFANGIAVGVIKIKIVSTESLELNNSSSKQAPTAPIELDEVVIRGGSDGGGNDTLGYSYILSGGSFGSYNMGGSNTGNYFNPPHSGGGGSSSNTKPSIDEAEQNPCDKIKELLNNPAFKAKLNALKLKTGLTKENGFAQDKNGVFTTLTANGSDAVGMPKDVNRIGYMHTHLDPYDKPNANGDLEPVEPIKMFSPDDVRQFLKIVVNAQNNNIPIGDVYGPMVSSTGTYQLKFTGNVADINVKNSNIKWDENLDKIYEGIIGNNGLEKGFLKFLKDKIGIDGIELYKVETNRNSKITLNSNGKIVPVNCN